MFPELFEIIRPIIEDGHLNYKKAKERATAFQEAKDTLHSYLSAVGKGYWIKKPVEVDHFDIAVQVYIISRLLFAFVLKYLFIGATRDTHASSISRP